MLLLLSCTQSAPETSTELQQAFQDASDQAGVPYSILVAISYELTRFDQRYGAENRESGVGVMNLHQDGTFPSIEEAAATSGISEAEITDSAKANILASAHLLSKIATNEGRRIGDPVDDLKDWYPIVAAFSGSADPLVGQGFAEEVYDWIQWGLIANTPEGEVVELKPTELSWRDNKVATAGSGLSAQWIPACSSNYTDSSRGAGSIDKIVIHTMEGSYSGSISWFQNCSASVSAHYVIRSSDGEITQMVDEADIGWHAGHWDTNERSIGIEHEGYVASGDRWYTDSMYRASAELVRDICDRYGIPKDRSHIIGHNEVPGCSTPGGGGSGCHTDPGSYWDWTYFISLVNQQGSGSPNTNSGMTDGTRQGSFSAKVRSSNYPDSDSCSGSVSGAVNGGQFYLTGKCTLADHPDKAKDLPVTWSGTVGGGSLEGKMVVDGRSAEFSGTTNGDSLNASFSGSEDVGGSAGVISFEVSFEASP
jgi:N-acetyl-anhydromuramyl-L-alanine amidase AmpD